MIRALVLLALLGAAVALPKKINRIVGGEATTIEEYPFMSNMQHGMLGIWWFQSCGGSLINSHYVLSAAHCYEGDSPSEWRVKLGATNVNAGTNFAVTQLKLHEHYNSATLKNDIALVKLDKAVTFSTTIQQALIPYSGYIVPDQAVVTAIGWGALAQSGGFPTILQKVDVEVVNQEVCAARYAHLKTLPNFQHWPDVTPEMLCAGILDVGGKDSCQGDSGGPLAHFGNVVVGVISWGFGCANSEYPGVYARVSKYTHWIQANAQ